MKSAISDGKIMTLPAKARVAGVNPGQNLTLAYHIFQQFETSSFSDAIR